MSSMSSNVLILLFLKFQIFKFGNLSWMLFSDFIEQSSAVILLKLDISGMQAISVTYILFEISRYSIQIKFRNPENFLIGFSDKLNSRIFLLFLKSSLLISVMLFQLKSTYCNSVKNSIPHRLTIWLFLKLSSSKTLMCFKLSILFNLI